MLTISTINLEGDYFLVTSSVSFKTHLCMTHTYARLYDKKLHQCQLNS